MDFVFFREWSFQFKICHHWFGLTCNASVIQHYFFLLLIENGLALAERKNLFRRKFICFYFLLYIFWVGCNDCFNGYLILCGGRTQQDLELIISYNTVTSILFSCYCENKENKTIHTTKVKLNWIGYNKIQ